MTGLESSVVSTVAGVGAAYCCGAAVGARGATGLTGVTGVAEVGSVATDRGGADRGGAVCGGPACGAGAGVTTGADVLACCAVSCWS